MSSLNLLARTLGDPWRTARAGKRGPKRSLLRRFSIAATEIKVQLSNFRQGLLSSSFLMHMPIWSNMVQYASMIVEGLATWRPSGLARWFRANRTWDLCGWALCGALQAGTGCQGPSHGRTEGSRSHVSCFLCSVQYYIGLGSFNHSYALFLGCPKRKQTSTGLIHHGHFPSIFLFHGNQVGRNYLLVG